jgi:hypothetical protein
MGFRDRILKKIGSTLADATKTGGRYSLRVGKGLTRHAAGQIGKQGARKILGRHYNNLSDLQKELVDECGEIAGRIVTNRIQDGMMIFGPSDFEQEAESQQEELASVLMARIRSKVYDGLAELFVDKPPRPNGELILQYDVIKQLIMAGIAEILDARQRDFS